MAVAESARPVSLGQEQDKPRSPWRDAWAQFRQNRGAILGLIFVIGLVFIALTASLWRNMGLIDDPSNQHRGSSLAAPMTCATDNAPGQAQFCFVLGADELGRDLASRVIYGTQVSLAVGVVGTAVSLTVGTIYGLISGFYGGRIDNLMMRIIDFLYGLPDLVLIILIQVFFKTLAAYGQDPAYRDKVGVLGVTLVDINNRMGGLFFLFIVIGLLSWLGVARLVRGQVLSYKEKEFIEAARAIGARDRRILFVHLLPNVIGPIIVVAALSVPGFISLEALLSVLGLGVNPPTPSWGAMIDNARKLGFQSYPHMVIVPSLALSLVLLAFIFLGDGLRDALDPRLRGK